MLIDSGEKINKFYQERLKYINELKYELEKNPELLEEIEKTDNFIYEQNWQIRDDVNESEINIDVLNRDLDRLNNLNQEHLDTINEYKQKLIDEKAKYDEDINSFKNDIYTEKMLREELLKRYENLEKDNKELETDLKLSKKNSITNIDKANDLRDKIKEDKDKILNMLNKFNDNMDNNMNNFNKEYAREESKNRLDKLNDDIKKKKNYIKDNNEKINIKDLEDIDNRYDNLIDEYDILRDIINEYKDEIKKMKRKPNKTKDDFNKIKDLEKKLALQNDAINDNEYFLRIKENIIKNKKQTLSTLDKINIDEAKKIKEYDDMPYLETEEESAENVADINEQRDVTKKDNKAKTFAPSDSAEKNKTNKTEKIVSDSNKDDNYKNIKIFYDDNDDNIKISYHDDDNIK